MKFLHANSLASLPEALRLKLLWSLTAEQAEQLVYDWPFRARPNQLPPEGEWRVWLLLAGRGFGKTRTGAEFVRARVAAHTARRIALVAPTAADARDVIVEGESGLLAISPPWDRPVYEPSKRRLTWQNGAIATTYSADEPERLRGPQHDFAWCDELGADGAHQYDRLAEAAALDRDAALQSASWGMFQIMGMNYTACGFSGVEDYVTAMCVGEAGQLDAFAAFCRHGGLDHFLRAHDWTHFALAYNGPSEAENDYDAKLAAAYKRRVAAKS